VVTLVARTGQILCQGTTLGGNVQFKGVAATEYTIKVVAPGYESVAREIDGYSARVSTITIDMRRASNGKTGAGSLQIILAPKAQKELGKALEALRVNKLEQARTHLEAAYRKAPNHPAVNYLFGVYFRQMQDLEKAMGFWTKTLEFDPNHALALLSLSEALVRETRLEEAETYVRRAVEADPSSWRAHAIRADVLLKEGLAGDAIKEAKTFKYEVPLESEQGGEVTVEGRRAVMLASNNYLGLTLHPDVTEASRRAVLEYGTGTTGSRTASLRESPGGLFEAGRRPERA